MANLLLNSNDNCEKYTIYNKTTWGPFAATVVLSVQRENWNNITTFAGMLWNCIGESDTNYDTFWLKIIPYVDSL
jgi:hypothetical protein